MELSVLAPASIWIWLRPPQWRGGYGPFGSRSLAGASRASASKIYPTSESLHLEGERQNEQFPSFFSGGRRNSCGVGIAGRPPRHGPPATAPGQNKLLCFDGTTDGGFGGVCTLKANGAKGPATLNNTDSNAAGDYAGVYYANTTMSGQALGAVTQPGYTYSGTTVHAGPRRPQSECAG
jgi:hypothetical protein